MPHVALFGKKDFQQLAIIRRMTSDLNMPVEIVGMPIVREADGLAMSSRNAYLSAEERQRALLLSRSLSAAQGAYRAGERSVERLHALVREIITSAQAVQIDYIDFRDGETLEDVSLAADNTLLALAVKIGKTRLIDNCLLGRSVTLIERFPRDWCMNVIAWQFPRCNSTVGRRTTAVP